MSSNSPGRVHTRAGRLRRSTRALALTAGISAAGLLPACASTPSLSAPPAGQTAFDSHACVPPGEHPVTVPWDRLRNPVLAYPDAAVKDQALAWAGGSWHMLFSYITNDVATPGAERWHIAVATSPDLSRWTAPQVWPEQPGTLGVASPDLVRSPEGYYVATYQSDPGEAGGGQDKLYYRTSHDLVTWSSPHRLLADLYTAPRDRLIDAALAWTGKGWILGYKLGTPGSAQHFQVAYHPGASLAGPWEQVGRPGIAVYGDTVENYEFVQLQGRWHLLATSNTFDRPWLFTLASDPSHPSGWLHWVAARELAVPSETWNTGPGVSGATFEHANSAFVCDAGDGFFYLTYAGSDELTHFGGWGHAKIGVARSTDLYHWVVPAAPG